MLASPPTPAGPPPDVRLHLPTIRRQRALSGADNLCSEWIADQCELAAILQNTVRAPDLHKIVEVPGLTLIKWRGPTAKLTRRHMSFPIQSGQGHAGSVRNAQALEQRQMPVFTGSWEVSGSDGN